MLAKISSRRAGREGQVPAAEEEPEDREIDNGCDEGSDPDGHAKPEREVENVAEAEQKR